MPLPKRSFQEVSILVIEDSMDLRDQLTRVLESSKMGFSVEALPSTAGLNKKLLSGKYDALLIDYDLGVGDASSILRNAKEIDSFLPVILISRNFEDRIHMEAAKMGADSYVPLSNVSLKMLPEILMKRIEYLGFVRDATDSRHQSTLKSYQIEILASLVRKMVETNDLKSVMQELAEQVVKKLDMKVVSLQRFIQSQQGFAVYGIYPQGKLVKSAQMFFGVSLDTFVFPYDPDNCIVDRYAADRKPWVGTDFADVFGTTMPSQAARMVQKFAGVNAIYNAPFYCKDQLLGGILVGNVRNSFTDEELEAFDAIVHISSLLFEYNESIKSQMVQNDKLQAIREASSQLHENLDPERLFDIIHEKLDIVVPADVARLYLCDESKNALIEKRILLKKGKRPPFMVSEISLGVGLIGGAAVKKRSLLENNAHLNPSAVYASESPDFEHLLAVPVTHHSQLLGMIALSRLTDQPFEETDREALEIFTSQFAVALHNSRLYENLSRSEGLYRLVLENVNDPVIFVGTDARFLYVNPKFEEVTGYKSEEVIGREFSFIMHPQDLPLVRNHYVERMRGKEAPSRYEFRIVTKSGEARTIDYNVTATKEEGRITGLLGVARDVTDERIAREELKKKTQQLQKILDFNASMLHSRDLDEFFNNLVTAAKDGIPEADAGSILIFDKAERRLTMSASVGYPAEMKDHFDPDLYESWSTEVFATGTPMVINDTSDFPNPEDKDRFPAPKRMKSAVVAPLEVDDEILGVISLGNFSRTYAFRSEHLLLLESFAHQAALAVRKEQMHSDIRESELRYRAITESSSDLIVVTCGKGRIEFCNDRFLKTFGLDSGSATGRSVVDFFEKDSRELIAMALDPVGPGKKRRVTAIIDGLRYHFDIVSSTINTEAGASRRILFLNDVSDLVRASDWMEKAYEVGLKRTGIELIESYAGMLSDVFNTELVYIGDYDEKNDVSLAHVAKVGDSYLHTVKVEGVRGLLENKDRESRCLESLFKSEKGWKSFYTIPMEVENKCVGIIILPSERIHTATRAQMSILQLVRQRLAFEYERQRNETETRRLETQLRHSQKMESLGTLAGGVAHDFNNILGAILGYSGLLRTELKDNEKLSRYLDTIEKSAQRAAELTKQLLGFARGGKTTVTNVDFNRICTETVSLTRKMIEKNIDVVLQLHGDLPVVEGDESQLSQVVMNLVLNARDSMPSGGELRITTRLSRADEIPTLKLDIENKDHVVVEVTDNGFGISKENLPRIFEPFFTTKPKGKGTGLGLSMVYGIVKNHGGEIEVESETDKGTTFRVYLPASLKKARARGRHVESEIRKVVEGKRCLVVDDELEIRELLAESLTRFGFNVVTVESGEKAVEFVKREPKIDVVVLDMIMPGMDGSETYSEIHKIRPDIPVLVATGYSAEGKVQDILNRGGIGILYKPFTLEDLRRKLVDRFAV